MFTIEYSKISKADHTLIQAIYERANREGLNVHEMTHKYYLLMDLSAVHAAHGLQLRALLDADLSNFAHDVCGIQRHLDRDTGELTDCFTPRFARANLVSHDNVVSFPAHTEG